MSMLDWAFAEDLPTAEKLVLVYLASLANTVGIGRMDRAALGIATGYKKRSLQRLIKSLKDVGLLEESGCWYMIGDMDSSKLTDVELEQLPTGSPLRYGTASADGLQIMVDVDAIAQAVGDHVIDQFANFEARITQQIDQRNQLGAGTLTCEPGAAVADPVRSSKIYGCLLLTGVSEAHAYQAAVILVEHIEPEPVDPVIENPLYQQLLDGGMDMKRAYALSEADLEMGDDTEAQPVEDAGEDEYTDNDMGRFARILDILHGAESEDFDSRALRRDWVTIEVQENKFTVKGEQHAFLLLYPQIVAAAKANVGKLTISEFCDVKRAARCDAPWHHELKSADKEDPALELEIGTMLAAIEASGNTQCQVQPRTTEKLDGGSVVQETLLGFHRRVKAKHSQMLQQKEMGIL